MLGSETETGENITCIQFKRGGIWGYLDHKHVPLHLLFGNEALQLEHHMEIVTCRKISARKKGRSLL